MIFNDNGYTSGVAEDNNEFLHDLGNFDDDIDPIALGNDDTQVDFNNHNVRKNNIIPKVQDRKRKKWVQIFSQHLDRICDVLQSRNAMASKSSDKIGCSIDEVMDVVRGIVDGENDIDILMTASEYSLQNHIEKCL